MPAYDFVCTNQDCAKVTAEIVASWKIETIPCPACGSPANLPDTGWGGVDSKSRHVGVYFNFHPDVLG